MDTKIITKTYTLRIYPTIKQEKVLQEHFDGCRFVFNYFLGRKMHEYLNKSLFVLDYHSISKELTQMKQSIKYGYLRKVNSQSLQAEIRELDTLYRRFYVKQDEFPMFKSKEGRQQFKVPQYVTLEGDLLTIPKFKGGIKVEIDDKIAPGFGNRPTLDYKVSSATIIRERIDEYYVCLVGEVEHSLLFKTGQHGAVVTNIYGEFVLSDGTVVEGDKEFMITYVVSMFDLVVVLKDDIVPEMMDEIEKRLEWNDKELVVIERLFLNDRLCGECDWVGEHVKVPVVKANKLKHKWVCKVCGTEHDYWVNKAKNILRQASID